MIEINVQMFDDGMQFITDFTIPDGEKVVRDIDNYKETGFDRLMGFEGEKAIMKYSDGHQSTGHIHDISEHCFYFTDDEELQKI